MTLVRPSFAESLFNSFFSLESDRMMYYGNVVRMAKSIMKYMGDDESLDELNALIKQKIEHDLNAPFQAVIHSFYNPRFMMSKRAYTKVGDVIDYKIFTRYEIMVRLEEVKEFCYDRVTTLSQMVRFTNQQPIMS